MGLLCMLLEDWDYNGITTKHQQPGNLFSLLRLGSVRFVLRSPREKWEAEPLNGPLWGCKLLSFQTASPKGCAGCFPSLTSKWFSMCELSNVPFPTIWRSEVPYPEFESFPQHPGPLQPSKGEDYALASVKHFQCIRWHMDSHSHPAQPPETWKNESSHFNIISSERDLWHFWDPSRISACNSSWPCLVDRHNFTAPGARLRRDFRWGHRAASVFRRWATGTMMVQSSCLWHMLCLMPLQYMYSMYMYQHDPSRHHIF